MKRYKKLISLSIIITTIVIGCSKKNIIKNNYVEGQDYQYMFYNPSQFESNQAKGELGYYIMKNNYIYIVDKESLKTVPLCNKTNCLHDRESDDTKKNNCNAYISLGNQSEQQIQYYDGFLYCMSAEIDEEKQENYYDIYKISQDGTTKDIVGTIRGEHITSWMIHRGNMYYTAEEYDKLSQCIETNNETPVPKTVFYERELKNISKGSKVLYRSPKNVAGEYDNNILAYGNFIYIHDRGGNITSEEGPWELWGKYYAYNILNGEMTEIISDEGELTWTLCIYNDKLIYNGWNVNADSNGIYYISNLDGTDRKKLEVNVVGTDLFFSDGRYLYKDNYRTIKRNNSNTEGAESQIITVYDKEYKEIDSFKLPFKEPKRIASGDNKYIFFINEDNALITISYFDKEKLGTINGSQIELIHCYERN